MDFTITNPFITIPRTAENGTKMCFTFANVINDERIEDTERAIFFLTSNNFADVSRDTSFTIEIIDNDCKSDNHLAMLMATCLYNNNNNSCALIVKGMYIMCSKYLGRPTVAVL